MHGNKIHNHTYLILMTPFYKSFQLLRRSVSGGGAEKSRNLVSPGFIAGVLRQRHQLHIVVSLFFQVGDKALSQFFIIIPIFCFIGRPLPGTCMNLIDIHSLVPAYAPLLHPCLIIKIKSVLFTDEGSVVRPHFHLPSVRIAVIPYTPVRSCNPILIHLPRSGVPYAALPEIPVMDLLHVRSLPAVKFSDDLYPPGCRRKGTKHRSFSLPECT